MGYSYRHGRFVLLLISLLILTPFSGSLATPGSGTASGCAAEGGHVEAQITLAGSVRVAAMDCDHHLACQEGCQDCGHHQLLITSTCLAPRIVLPSPRLTELSFYSGILPSHETPPPQFFPALA